VVCIVVGIESAHLSGNFAEGFKPLRSMTQNRCPLRHSGKAFRCHAFVVVLDPNEALEFDC
jgi:hypothetical protein